MHPHRPVVADDVNTYECCKCGCGFQTEEKLLQHQEKFAADLNCDMKLPGKKRGRKPKNPAEGEISDSKKSEHQEELVRCKAYDGSPTEGCPSTELQPELKIPCPEANCDLIFPSVAALRAHKREEHMLAPSSSHTCTECDEGFSEADQLRAHIFKFHRFGYTCPTCGKTFVRESVLKVHLNIHTREQNVAEER